MTTKPISQCAAAVAQLLYNAGIRLRGESDLLAIDHATPLQRSHICALYRAAMGADFEFLVTDEDFAEKTPAAILEAACWRHVAGKLTDEVDRELWQLQCAEQREAREWRKVGIA